MLDAKNSMAMMVVAVIMMVTLMPQFNEASKEEKVYEVPELPDAANFKLNYCGEIIDAIHKKLDATERKNPDKVFEVGYKKWKPILKKLNPVNYMMAKAWKNTRLILKGQKECDKETGRDIALLMTCFNMGVLHETMGKEVRAVSDKCTSSIAYWEQQYDEIQKLPKFPKKHYDNLKKFINKEFIGIYKSEYPAEPLSLVNPCCESRKAWKSTFASFQSVAMKAECKTATELKEKPDPIGEIYDKWVVKSCAKTFLYLQMYMLALQQVSQIIEGGSDRFIQKLKQDVQEDVFRYKFCLNLFMSNNNIHEQKRGIAWNILYPELDYGRVSCYN